MNLTSSIGLIFVSVAVFLLANAVASNRAPANATAASIQTHAKLAQTFSIVGMVLTLVGNFFVR